MRLPRGSARPGHPYLAGAPLLIAHRGGSALAPENTLVAFRRAVEWWKADLLEIDVHATADGVPVVHHDATVDRTTDGQGPIKRWRLHDLRQLDAGYRFTPDAGATFPFRGRGTRVPTLEEVLLEFPRQRVNVEVKDHAAQRPVWDLVHATGSTQRVLIAAGRRANRARFGHYSGATSASGEEMRIFYALHLMRLAQRYSPGVDAFQIPERYLGRQVLTPRFVADAHALNVAVHIWTVDDVSDMRRLLAWGVDGIVTDRPDRLARVLHELVGRPLPPGPSGDREPFLERLLRS